MTTRRRATPAPWRRAGVRVLGVMLLTVAGLATPAGVTAQALTQRELARELARLLLAGVERQGMDEQVGAGIMRSMGGLLEERLNRRLLEVEWQMLARIVRRFVADTLPPSRAEDIAAEVYLRHFDEGELADLLRFQRSAVGRKAARLTPVIALETAQAIDDELRRSPVAPRMLEELRRAFPVLDPPQSP